MTINQRIETIINQLGISPNRFASNLSVHPTIIYHILNGRNKPSFDILDKIINHYKVNPTWLFLGIGDMLISNKEHDPTEEDLNHDLKAKFIDIHRMYLNLLFIQELLVEKFKIQLVLKDINEEAKILTLFSDRIQNLQVMSREDKKSCKQDLNEVESLFTNRFLLLFMIFRQLSVNNELNPQDLFNLVYPVRPIIDVKKYFNSKQDRPLD